MIKICLILLIILVSSQLSYSQDYSQIKGQWKDPDGYKLFVSDSLLILGKSDTFKVIPIESKLLKQITGYTLKDVIHNFFNDDESPVAHCFYNPNLGEHWSYKIFIIFSYSDPELKDVIDVVYIENNELIDMNIYSNFHRQKKNSIRSKKVVKHN